MMVGDFFLQLMHDFKIPFWMCFYVVLKLFGLSLLYPVVICEYMVY